MNNSPKDSPLSSSRPPLEFIYIQMTNARTHLNNQMLHTSKKLCLTLLIPLMVSTSSCSTFNLAFHRKSVRDTKSPWRSRICKTTAIKMRNSEPSAANPSGNLFETLNKEEEKRDSHDIHFILNRSPVTKLVRLLSSNPLCILLNQVDRKQHNGVRIYEPGSLEMEIEPGNRAPNTLTYPQC